MTFTLLDYVEKLENVEEKGSWLLADCPVCHNHKLKINASTGAYKCYANDCKAQQIRESVAKYTPYVKTNLRVARRSLRRYLDAEPLYISKTVLESFSAYFLRCDRKEDIDRQYYVYTGMQRTVRFITKEEKKIVAPQYWNQSEKFVSGVGTSEWLLFNEQYLQEYCIFNKYDNQYIIMAEGEKCAASVTQQGYECLTPAGFCFTPEYLDNAVKRLQLYGLKGVLYFEDNDTAGRKKSHVVSNACWRNSLTCTVINPSFLRSGAVDDDGFDIADNRYELEDLVTMWIT